MNLFKRNKEPERFYLLPGMGGRARRRKELVFLQWSIAVGLVVSVALWLIMYWANGHP
jgi:hypothetical protein